MVSKYVDMFFGNGEIDHPTPQGIAATWFSIKYNLIFCKEGDMYGINE